MKEETLQFRQLGPGDRVAVARLAERAFYGNSFYEKALGLDSRRFKSYWDAFFRLSLADPTAVVFGLERDGELQAAVAASFDGFPRTDYAVRYLLELLFRLGFTGFIHYLRFIRAYSRTMHRPAAEKRIEACGLWLFVSPQTGSAGLGSYLVRRAIDTMHARGKILFTGFIDASNRPLLRFYQRLGFTVSPPFLFTGMRAACVERWLEPLESLEPLEAVTDAEH